MPRGIWHAFGVASGQGHHLVDDRFSLLSAWVPKASAHASDGHAATATSSVLKFRVSPDIHRATMQKKAHRTRVCTASNHNGSRTAPLTACLPQALDEYTSAADLFDSEPKKEIKEGLSQAISVAKAAPFAAKGLVKLNSESMSPLVLRRSAKALLQQFKKANLTRDYWPALLYERLEEATKFQ